MVIYLFCINIFVHYNSRHALKVYWMLEKCMMTTVVLRVWTPSWVNPLSGIIWKNLPPYLDETKLVFGANRQKTSPLQGITHFIIYNYLYLDTLSLTEIII